jgi:hypothetical protein
LQLWDLNVINRFILDNMAVPWLRRLIACLSPRRRGFTPVSVHMGFLVDNMALRHVLSKFFDFPLSASFHRGSPY